MDKFNITEILKHCDISRIVDFAKLSPTRDSRAVQLFGFRDGAGNLSVFGKMGYLRGCAPCFSTDIPPTELLHNTYKYNIGWEVGDCSDGDSRFFCVFKCYDRSIDIGETMYHKVTGSSADNFLKSIEKCFEREVDRISLNIKFEDGDFICIEDSTGYYLAIFDKYEGSDIHYHALLDYTIREDGCFDISGYCVRPATDPEKQQLLLALSEIGKCWNSDTKAVENITTPSLNLKELDYFLAKTSVGRKMWMLYQYAFEKDDIIYAVGGWSFSKKDKGTKIVAYNDETKHLLGTSDEIQESESNV